MGGSARHRPRGHRLHGRRPVRVAADQSSAATGGDIAEAAIRRPCRRFRLVAGQCDIARAPGCGRNLDAITATDARPAAGPDPRAEPGS
jgi:hypothetical protein